MKREKLKLNEREELMIKDLLGLNSEDELSEECFAEYCELLLMYGVDVFNDGIPFSFVDDRILKLKKERIKRGK